MNEADATHVVMLLRNDYTHDTRVEKEAQTLVGAGYRVTVVAEAGAGLDMREVRDGVHVRRVRRPVDGIPGLRFVAQRVAFVRALIATHPDVLHAHDTEVLETVAAAAAWLRVPFVYDAHDLWLGRMRRQPSAIYWWLYRRYYGLVEHFLLPRAAAAITVSGPIARHLERTYQLQRVDVVANLPDIDAVPVPRDLRSLPGAEAIPPDAPIVVYLGHVMSGRGVEHLIEAMGEVPRAHLVLLGGGDQRDLVTQLANAAGVGDRVHALPRVPIAEVLDYAASAQVGVSPIEDVCLNYRYSLPNKLFQYMAAGLPVVASDFDQVRDVVEGAAAGLTVDPSSATDIARAVRALVEDPGLATEMGRNARAAVEARYNWGTAAATLIGVYRRVRPPGAGGRHPSEVTASTAAT
jgi:glycosyltransferase involved in cell wall biosynthesis